MIEPCKARGNGLTGVCDAPTCPLKRGKTACDRPSPILSHTEIVVIGDVDVDKEGSAWGWVRVHTPKKKKTTTRKIFFHSPEEWREFHAIWKNLQEPWQMRYTKVPGATRGFWHVCD